MAYNATCYGGPKDGEIHRVIGSEMYYPERRELRFIPEDADRLLPEATPRTGRYVLRRDDDGKYVYVHESLMRHA